MDKRTLIGYVEELIENTTIKEIISDKDGKKIIGKSQFRTIAELCAKADFYEEIKLLIEYKTAKGSGWNEKIDRKNNKNCGQVIMDYMKKIVENSDNLDEKDILKNLGLFFGYLHWKAAVLCCK